MNIWCIAALAACLAFIASLAIDGAGPGPAVGTEAHLRQALFNPDYAALQPPSARTIR